MKGTTTFNVFFSSDLDTQNIEMFPSIDSQHGYKNKETQSTLIFWKSLNVLTLIAVEYCQFYDCESYVLTNFTVKSKTSAGVDRNENRNSDKKKGDCLQGSIHVLQNF